MQWYAKMMATGVEAVDNQHQEIIKKVNDLKQAVNSGAIKEKEINGMIVFLTEYVIEHFRTEEALQMEIDYYGYDEHRREHEDLIKKVSAMHGEFQRGGITFENIHKLIAMLETWLLEHIAGSDSMFAKCYRQATQE